MVNLKMNTTVDPSEAGAQAGETPSQALQIAGVGYVELRAVDVNPYSPIGIDENTAAFLEVLALHCLLQESPDLLDPEQEQIERNLFL